VYGYPFISYILAYFSFENDSFRPVARGAQSGYTFRDKNEENEKSKLIGSVREK